MKAVVCVTFGLAIAASNLVNAQDNNDLVLEEIIVSAQKRDQSIQDVPVSILALSGEELSAAGAFNFEDYATSIPNLSFGAKTGGGHGRASGRNIAIRGISGAGTTAVYIDEIPLPESIDLKIVDVDRVEILRGPQGSLYGASSMGGALRILTNKPDPSATSLSISTTASAVNEGDQNYRLSGIYNLPIASNKGALRFAAFYNADSGVYDRIVTDPANAGRIENVDDTQTIGVHASMLFAPNDRLAITPKIIYQNRQEDGFPWADTTIDNFDQFRIHGVEEPFEEDLLHTSVAVNYEFETGQFVSSTSYLRQDLDETEDFTEFAVFAFGLMPPPPSPIIIDSRFEKVVQEFRFASSLDSQWQYVVGVFYSREESTGGNMTVTPGLEAYAADQFGLPPGTPVFGGSDLVFSANSDDVTKDSAVFGELTYAFNDQWQATLGLRYYDISRTTDAALDGIVNGGPSTFIEKLSEDGINPKVSLSHHVTDDAMIYATAAKGYRPGGFNGNAQGVSSFCQADLAALGISASPSTYLEDSLWNYELGSKTTWANGRVRLNGAVFFVDWDKLQQDVNLPCGFSLTANVGQAESTGVEIEVDARPTEALSLSMGVGYVDANISDAGGNPSVSDGDHVLEVPRWTYNASAEYMWPTNNGASWALTASVNGASESFTAFDFDNPLRRRAPSTVADLRLRYTTDHWGFTLFADNLTDERVNFSDGVSIAAEVPGRPRIATNRPRTIGISVQLSL